MSDTETWEHVIHSKKARRELKRQEQLKQAQEQERMERLALYEHYAKTAVPEGSYVDAKNQPISSTYPPLNRSASILLSEQLGTTDPIQIASMDASFSKELKKFIAKYSVPIYHISYEYYHDMGYDRKGRRCPVSFPSRMYIWTYHKSFPIVHVYEAYELKNIQYSITISPFLEDPENAYEEEWWDMDVVLRLMKYADTLPVES
jgi:hypothetical protein